MKKEVIIVVDGYSFLFRAYHSMPALSRSSDGVPVGALYGFTSMLMKLLLDMKPTHIVVVFDSGGKNFRHEIYSAYKANRPPAPEDLIPQFPLVREAAKALNIAILEQIGYEADDIIATLAYKARKNGEEVLIISSDKDLMQLVNGHTKMYDAIRSKMIGIEQVEEKYGVKPEKMRDLLALVGDTSDNVPGVPSIGPKTAAELLNNFETIEGVFANLDTIKQPKRRQVLEDNKEIVELSRKLVSLKNDLELNISFEDLKAKKIDSKKLLDFLHQQDFKSLAARAKKELLLEDVPESERKFEFNPSVARVICDLRGLQELSLKASEYGVLALYLQTNFINHEEVKTIEDIDSIAVFVSPQHSYYIPITVDDTKQASLLEEIKDKKFLSFAEVIAGISAALKDDAILKIFHDYKKFLHLVKPLHEYIKGIQSVDDIMLMSYDLGSGRDNTNYSKLIEFYFEEKDEIIDGGRVKSFGRFVGMDSQEKLKYITQKAYYVYEAHKILQRLLFEYKQQSFYQKIDRFLPQIVYEIECNGFKVDPNILSKLSQTVDEKLEIISREVYKLAGSEFNIASPQQLAEVLFQHMGIQPPRKSKTGSYSTGIEVLEDLQNQGHTIADSIIEWRKFYKIKTTYTASLLNQINKNTGRIHTNFSLASTATGRFSSTDPNLQNIPVKGEFANEIRSAFIAGEGYKILSADYSQIELRLLADIAAVKALQEAFINHQDIHAITASEVFGVDINQMTLELRNKAKAINFGIIYGISAYGLAKNLGISNSEASSYIKKYFERYPGIQGYMEEMKSFARQHGYVETIMGRRCYVHNINSNDPNIRAFAERASINFPLQGSNADIVRKAIIEVDKMIKKERIDCRLILQVHDELLFEVKDSEVERARKLISEVMENIIALSVPIVVGFSCGNSWIK